MLQYARPLQRVVEELQKLPGIGPKSAQRLALYILNSGAQSARAIGEAISALPDLVHRCRICGNWSDNEVCPICADSQRDCQTICVVTEVPDLMAFERSGEFCGVYHVLGGLLSPLEGIGPDDIAIASLLERIDNAPVKEIILATSPSVEGDATAEHIRRLLTRYPHLIITRIALGLPVGADLDYQDQVTVARALTGRRQME